MLADADERRHADAAVEAWWWWAWSADGATGLFVGLELRGRRFDYWAGLVRPDAPYLYVEELYGEGLRSGLEVKPPEMWAGHTCDAPFRQWSLGNEAHGVLLDDPADALHRPFGDRAPVTFDVEWYATAPAEPCAHGYEQCGEVDARVELSEGLLQFGGASTRLHVWGVPHTPSALAMPVGPMAPYRRGDGRSVLQVLTRAGFVARTVVTP